MKTNLTSGNKLHATILATLLGAGAYLCQAAPPPPHSPVGRWDCVTSGGGQDGIIFLNFTTDIDTNNGLPTFEGIFINAGVRSPGSSSSSRNAGVGTGRNASASNPNTNLFGGGSIQGAGSVSNNGGTNDWFEDSRGFRGDWSYDSKGRVVGSYFTIVNISGQHTNFFQTCTNVSVTVLLTNGTFYTSPPVDVCFIDGPTFSTNLIWGPAADGETGITNVTLIDDNFTVAPAGLTNNVSFVGKVVPGKRLTMVGSTIPGQVTFRGVPLVPVTTAMPLNGPFFWSGNKTQEGTQFGELFKLSPWGIPNVYNLSGQGPSYTYNGTNSFCLISSQRKIGFSILELPLGTVNPLSGGIRATFGNFINTKKTIGAQTSGFIESDANRIQFNPTLVPFSAP